MLSTRSWRDQPQTAPGLNHVPLAKRGLDLMLCLVLGPVVMLLLLVIAVAILVDSGRPIFFVQERIGRGGRPFRMIKFRTLRRDFNTSACRDFMQAFVRGVGEPDTELGSRRLNKPIATNHITRVGRILRKTSLDELPQLINVMRGEMSIVGPRPNVRYEVEAYRAWHRRRFHALPGITGLAQVRGRSDISFDTIVRHDIEYIEHQSLRLDLLILWWTVESVLTSRGAG